MLMALFSSYRMMPLRCLQSRGVHTIHSRAPNSLIHRPYNSHIHAHTLQLLMMPEDDKTWSMLESSYNTLEFDYVPNPTQVWRAQFIHGSIRIILCAL